MKTAAVVSEQEYLQSSYDPDCELVSGQLLERNVGKRQHCILQGELVIFFWALRRRSGIRAIPEVRIRVATGRYRIPDVSVYREPVPREDVFTTPPFIAIEILSDEDRMSRIRLKIDDYLQFGVPYVWIIDPERRQADVYTPEGFYEAKDLVLRTENPQIELHLAELFRGLDE